MYAKQAILLSLTVSNVNVSGVEQQKISVTSKLPSASVKRMCGVRSVISVQREPTTYKQQILMAVLNVSVLEKPLDA